MFDWRTGCDDYDCSLEIHVEDDVPGVLDHNKLLAIARKHGFAAVYVFYKDGTRSGSRQWCDGQGRMARTSWNNWNKGKPVFDLAGIEPVELKFGCVHCSKPV